MKAGQMTTGLTNFSPDDDPVAPLHMSSQALDDGSRIDLGTDSDGDKPEAANDSPADSWRGEVAARLQRYRTRRKPSSPRYPSLLLPFDPPEYRYRASPPKAVGSSALDLNALDSSALDLNRGSQADHSHSPQAGPNDVYEREFENEARRRNPLNEPAPNRHVEPADFSAKIIEFPRTAAIPELRTSDLADPVVDRPRIVEAPEVLPPPPALGGMLIEPTRNAALDKRDDLGLPSPPASILRRLAAASVDAGILGVALAAFSAIFLRLNPSEFHAPVILLAGMSASAAIIAGMAYVFLFLVYTGSTPGLRSAKLSLSRFDGKPASRSLRRWRVLASFLSTFSAGLGYVWCFLDENGLCWHDRITRTYLRTNNL
jgi:uncharacterized RDD family membrane protein YckC